MPLAFVNCPINENACLKSSHSTPIFKAKLACVPSVSGIGFMENQRTIAYVYKEAAVCKCYRTIGAYVYEN